MGSNGIFVDVVYLATYGFLVGYLVYLIWRYRRAAR
jgi:hypothetical protein